MSAESPLRTYSMEYGCQVVISDASRHYYGGYYHVRLRVAAAVELTAEWFENRAAYEDALRRLGSPVIFSRILEKMAVPDVEIDSVRQSLISAFETNLVPYLVRPDFPRRFVISEYAKALTTVNPLRTRQP
jgi:hypothetical protein